jgi:hypothetical protein
MIPVTAWASSSEQASQNEPHTASSWNPLRWQWVPTQEEIGKYRNSWNPLSNGPILSTAVDIQPKGQSHVQFFVFGETGHEQFGNQLTTKRTDAPSHLDSVAPTLVFGHGITDHLEVDVAFTGIYWEASQPSPRGGQTSDSDVGIGDTALYLKYRPIIQDPDSWRPSIVIYNQLGLPTSDWFGTQSVPGGRSPLGKLPVTPFGALSFTEGVLFRKNVQPFRFTGGIYYSYAVPGHSSGMNTYVGDIVNTRFIVEYIHNEERGLGFNLEFVTLHGLPNRLDGHQLNVQPTSYTLFGIEPAIQYNFTSERLGGTLVGAAGVLFTVAGQNDIAAFYPNISFYWYWGKNGKVQMR